MGAQLIFVLTENIFGAIQIVPAIHSFILKPRKPTPGERPVFKPGL